MNVCLPARQSEGQKFENVEAVDVPRSPVLALLRRSRLVALIERKSTTRWGEALSLRFARKHLLLPTAAPSGIRKWISLFVSVGIAGISGSLDGMSQRERVKQVMRISLYSSPSVFLVASLSADFCDNLTFSSLPCLFKQFSHFGCVLLVGWLCRWLFVLMRIFRSVLPFAAWCIAEKLRPTLLFLQCVYLCCIEQNFRVV